MIAKTIKGAKYNKKNSFQKFNETVLIIGSITQKLVIKDTFTVLLSKATLFQLNIKIKNMDIYSF